MELVEGEDLSQRIARGPIPLAEALAIAKQVAAGLEQAHERENEVCCGIATDDSRRFGAD